MYVLFSYEYAKTILTLMTKEKHPDGKVLIIGGGIANFTNVAATFKGIVSALKRFKDKLQEFKIKIFIRRGGPNYQVRQWLIGCDWREKLICIMSCYGGFTTKLLVYTKAIMSGEGIELDSNGEFALRPI